MRPLLRIGEVVVSNFFQCTETDRRWFPACPAVLVKGYSHLMQPHAGHALCELLVLAWVLIDLMLDSGNLLSKQEFTSSLIDFDFLLREWSGASCDRAGYPKQFLNPAICHLFPLGAGRHHNLPRTSCGMLIKGAARLMFSGIVAIPSAFSNSLNPYHKGCILEFGGQGMQFRDDLGFHPVTGLVAGPVYIVSRPFVISNTPGAQYFLASIMFSRSTCSLNEDSIF
jgi:hypothetical protein